MLGRKGHTPLWQMFREPDLANVVGSLIEGAPGNETFLGAGLGNRRFVARLSPHTAYPFNASGLRGKYVLASDSAI